MTTSPPAAATGWSTRWWYGATNRPSRRLDEHRAAGADHVCIQVLSVEQPFPVMRGGVPFRLDGMRRLAPALTA